MAQSAQFKTIINCLYEKTEEMSTLTDSLSESRGLTFAEGTGANQINLIFHDQRALAASANEVLDINDGSLTNKVGQSITIDKLKALFVQNNSSDSSLKVFGGTTPVPWLVDASDIIEIPPGGSIVLVAPDVSGVDVTSNSNLKFEHGGEGSDDPDYDLILAGVDAA